MPIPVIILSGFLTRGVAWFADEVQETLSDKVFVVVDHPSALTTSKATLIHSSDEDMRHHGFTGCLRDYLSKDPVAWDKAFHLLAGDQVAFDHVWLIEDDVCFSRPELVSALIDRYRWSTADLLVRNFFRPKNKPEWSHWGRAALFPEPHQAGGFFPVVRLSRKMMSALSSFRATHGGFCFIETMLPSLVAQYGLSYEILDCLPARMFRDAPTFQRWEILQKVGTKLHNGIVHPVKSDDVRQLVWSRGAPASTSPNLSRAFFRLVGPAMETRTARRGARRLHRLANALSDTGKR